MLDQAGNIQSSNSSSNAVILKYIDGRTVRQLIFYNRCNNDKTQ